MGNLEVARGIWDLSSLIPSLGSYTHLRDEGGIQADGPSHDCRPCEKPRWHLTAVSRNAWLLICLSVCGASSVCGNYCSVCVPGLGT